MKKILILIFIVLFNNNLLAAPTEDKPSDGLKPASQFDIGKKWVSKAKKLEKKNKVKKSQNAYKKAIKSLLKHYKDNIDDADTLNLLGFSHRKIGDYKNAELYYALGLEINPNHVGINEYMGELFVVTNRIAEAKKRLDVLKNCNCKEYIELKQVIEGTKASKY